MCVAGNISCLFLSLLLFFMPGLLLAHPGTEWGMAPVSPLPCHKVGHVVPVSCPSQPVPSKVVLSHPTLFRCISFNSVQVTDEQFKHRANRFPRDPPATKEVRIPKIYDIYNCMFLLRL